MCDLFVEAQQLCDKQDTIIGEIGHMNDPQHTLQTLINENKELTRQLSTIQHPSPETLAQLRKKVAELQEELNVVKTHAKRMKAAYLASRDDMALRAALGERLAALRASQAAVGTANTTLEQAESELADAQSALTSSPISIEDVKAQIAAAVTATAACRVAAAADRQRAVETGEKQLEDVLIERHRLVELIREQEQTLEARRQAAAAAAKNIAVSDISREIAEQEAMLRRERINLAEQHAFNAETRAAELAGRLAELTSQNEAEIPDDPRTDRELEMEAQELKAEIYALRQSFRQQLQFYATH